MQPSSEYWICQPDGTILGPVGVEVIRDLAEAGRLNSGDTVSRDGAPWQSPEELPEIVSSLPELRRRN